jgi:hypothetical protein
MFLALMLAPAVRSLWFPIVTHPENSTGKNFEAEASALGTLQFALGRSETELGWGQGKGNGWQIAQNETPLRRCFS